MHTEKVGKGYIDEHNARQEQPADVHGSTHDLQAFCERHGNNYPRREEINDGAKSNSK